MVPKDLEGQILDGDTMHECHEASNLPSTVNQSFSTPNWAEVGLNSTLKSSLSAIFRRSTTFSLLCFLNPEKKREKSGGSVGLRTLKTRVKILCTNRSQELLFQSQLLF